MQGWGMQQGCLQHMQSSCLAHPTEPDRDVCLLAVCLQAAAAEAAAAEAERRKALLQKKKGRSKGDKEKAAEARAAAEAAEVARRKVEAQARRQAEEEERRRRQEQLELLRKQVGGCGLCVGTCGTAREAAVETGTRCVCWMFFWGVCCWGGEFTVRAFAERGRERGVRRVSEIRRERKACWRQRQPCRAARSKGDIGSGAPPARHVLTACVSSSCHCCCHCLHAFGVPACLSVCPAGGGAHGKAPPGVDG